MKQRSRNFQFRKLEFLRTLNIHDKLDWKCSVSNLSYIIIKDIKNFIKNNSIDWETISLYLQKLLSEPRNINAPESWHDKKASIADTRKPAPFSLDCGNYIWNKMQVENEFQKASKNCCTTFSKFCF